MTCKLLTKFAGLKMISVQGYSYSTTGNAIRIHSAMITMSLNLAAPLIKYSKEFHSGLYFFFWCSIIGATKPRHKCRSWIYGVKNYNSVCWNILKTLMYTLLNANVLSKIYTMEMPLSNNLNLSSKQKEGNIILTWLIFHSAPVNGQPGQCGLHFQLKKSYGWPWEQNCGLFLHPPKLAWSKMTQWLGNYLFWSQHQNQWWVSMHADTQLVAKWHLGHLISINDHLVWMVISPKGN